jgi:hypothetical protein
MAFKSLWLTSDGSGAVEYSAADFRQLLYRLFTTGVLGDSELEVAESGAPAMSVQVSAGAAIVPSATNEGRYLVWETAATTGVTIGSAPVTVGQSRNDLVCLFTKDPSASGGTAGRVTQVVVVAGTPDTTGDQEDPAVPDFHEVLARVTVENGTAAITDAMITDLRSFAKLAGDYVDDDNATRLGTSSGLAGELMRRDANGRARVNNPSDAFDIANKGYVDAVDTAVTPTGGTLDSGKIVYSRSAGIVHVITTAASGGATLPAGFRPAVGVAFDAGTRNITISTGGVIAVTSGGSPAQGSFVASFAAA